MNKKEIKEIKEQMYYLDSELYCYRDIDNLKEYAKNLEQENQQLKKQKDDVVKGLKDLKQFVYDELVDFNVIGATETHCKVMNLLRMLGEIDVED